jgi:hypothetical protein
MHTKFLSGKLKGKGHLEDLGIDDRTILRLLILKTNTAWTGFIWLSTGRAECSRDQCNELLGSIKSRNLLIS